MDQQSTTTGGVDGSAAGGCATRTTLRGGGWRSGGPAAVSNSQINRGRRFAAGGARQRLRHGSGSDRLRWRASAATRLNAVRRLEGRQRLRRAEDELQRESFIAR
ncbi:hypothetical protein Scep_030389 [Stephania cephalantha]|uniref:Uncharacterized protein n=1 Tax=Stephania cephalantha TaxID=152367 RepID=A0AAP0E7A7_9MAGN